MKYVFCLSCPKVFSIPYSVFRHECIKVWPLILLTFDLYSDELLRVLAIGFRH